MNETELKNTIGAVIDPALGKSLADLKMIRPLMEGRFGSRLNYRRPPIRIERGWPNWCGLRLPKVKLMWNSQRSSVAVIPEEKSGCGCTMSSVLVAAREGWARVLSRPDWPLP